MSSIFVTDLLSPLPAVLKNDQTMAAIANAMVKELVLLLSEVSSATIYATIDVLPEVLLDILAYDFKVDWWDASLSFSEKRATLKSSWKVHRKLGTPYAVETALSDIYNDTSVQEWFEYGGDPYHFKILIPIDLQSLDLTKHAKVLNRIAFYKNIRSVLDEVEYYGTGASTAFAAAGFLGCETIVTAVALND